MVGLGIIERLPIFAALRGEELEAVAKVKDWKGDEYEAQGK